MLDIIKNDPWLKPFEHAIQGRYDYVVKREKDLTQNGNISLSDFANGYLYFGLHKTESEWILR